MIIISLDIRGLGGETKMRYVRNLISKEGAKLVCIQETKTNSMLDAKYFLLWGDSNIGWLHNEGVDKVGSMLTMWHKEVFNYDNHITRKDFIVMFGQHIKSKRNISMVNVYAPCNMVENNILWEGLHNIKLANLIYKWCFFE